MTSTVVDVARDATHARARRAVRIGLLGLGRIGSAVASLARDDGARGRVALAIDRALVRTPAKHRASGVPIAHDAAAVLDARPDVLVEALGGVDPAREIVLEALSRGIPVVTANKSLIARCGDEIMDAAAKAGVSIRYEAAVIAGVPFLGTFATRPYASRVSGLSAILNGTSNFILSEVESGAEVPDAIATATRLGFAEPDPTKDLDGTDAAEKLTILLRHFAHVSVDTDEIPRRGILPLSHADLRCAAAVGGAIRPVAQADWSAGHVSAWVGPAFLRPSHPLFAVRRVANGICLAHDNDVPLVFSGPGAGPAATAATILDDVVETVTGTPSIHRPARAARLSPPVESSWLVRIGPTVRVPDARAVADLLASFDVWIRRTSDDGQSPDSRWFLTHACDGARLDRALHALQRAAGCEALAIPVLEPARG